MFMLEKSAREKVQVELGEFLREKRTSQNLTQGQVADVLGLESPQFISNIERGKCAIPIHIMRQLIKEYKLDRNEFLTFITDLQMSHFKKSLVIPKKAFKSGRLSV